MSRTGHSEVNQLFLDLNHISLLENCRNGMAATSRFYEGLKAVRDGQEVIRDSNVGALHEIVRELERVTLAYGPRRKDKPVQDAASRDADSLFPPDLGHLATPYANSEVRVRRLEILCLDANVNYGGEWALLSYQRDAEFQAAVRSWQQLLQASMRPSRPWR